MARRKIGATALVVALVAACASRSAAQPTEPASAQPSPSASAWATPRPTPHPTPVPSPVSATVDGVSTMALALGSRAAPIDVALAFGSIWIANHHSDTVTRMDPATMTIQASIDVGPGPGWFAVTEDAVWVSNQNGTGLTRVDARTNTAGTRAGRWAACGKPIVALGSIWQPACDAHRIMRIDPKTSEVVDLEAAGRFGIAQAGKTLLVGGPKGLARLDVATGAYTEIGGPDSWIFGFDGKTIWSSNDREVFRLRPADGTVAATIPLRETMSAIFRDGHAWLPSRDGLVDVDLATSKVVRTIGLGPITAIADAGDSIWATSYDGNSVTRVTP